MSADKKLLSNIKFSLDAPSYDQSPEYASGRRRYQLVLDEALKYGFNTWLDVGCGTGALLARFAETNNSVRLFGIDISEEMIKIAQSKLGERATFFVCDSEKLPFNDISFDLLTCTFSFHHYPNPQAVLLEMQRVLSQYGKLILIDPSPIQPLRALANLFAPFRRDGTVRYYSEREPRKLARAAGLKALKWQRLSWKGYIMLAEPETKKACPEP